MKTLTEPRGEHRLQRRGSSVWRTTGDSTCLAWYLRGGSSSVCSDQFNTTSQCVCRPPVCPLDPCAQRMLLAALYINVNPETTASCQEGFVHSAEHIMSRESHLISDFDHCLSGQTENVLSFLFFFWGPSAALSPRTYMRVFSQQRAARVFRNSESGHNVLFSWYRSVQITTVFYLIQSCITLFLDDIRIRP